LVSRENLNKFSLYLFQQMLLDCT